MEYDYLETPIGRLLLAADERGLRYVEFERRDQGECIGPDWRRGRARLGAVVEQLEAYFAGELHLFDLPLAAEGTDFRKNVWDELVQIPYGDTTSYIALARRLGNPNAMRAVGAANGANPIAIIVPCHRVIGHDGQLVGFGGGLPAKRWLLAHERHHAPAPLLELS